MQLTLEQVHDLLHVELKEIDYLEISDQKFWKIDMSNDQEMMYCSMLEIDGKKDYRIPSVDEIFYIQQLGIGKMLSINLTNSISKLQTFTIYPCIPVRDII